jgi:hypothetical protein
VPSNRIGGYSQAVNFDCDHIRAPKPCPLDSHYRSRHDACFVAEVDDIQQCSVIYHHVRGLSVIPDPDQKHTATDGREIVCKSADRFANGVSVRQILLELERVVLIAPERLECVETDR